MGVSHGQCLMSPAIMTSSPLDKSPNMGLFELIITLYIGVMIYFANLADLGSKSALTDGSSYSMLPPYGTLVRRMLIGFAAMVALFGLYADRVLLLDLSPSQYQELGVDPSAVSASSIVFITLLTALISVLTILLIMSPQFRQRIHILFGNTSRYNPESQLHLVAMVLALGLVGYLFTNFVIGGGLNGVAQSIEENGISL